MIYTSYPVQSGRFPPTRSQHGVSAHRTVAHSMFSVSFAPFSANPADCRVRESPSGSAVSHVLEPARLGTCIRAVPHSDV